MNNKFRVGDKIRLKTHINNKENREIYIIRKIKPMDEYPHILRYETSRGVYCYNWLIWDNNYSNGNEEITNFELVERRILKLKDFMRED